MNIEQQIGKTLANENGGGLGYVCIWRKKSDDPKSEHDYTWKRTVAEFLSIPQNQSGTWLIDGGWGSPPGPVHVRWNELTKSWENGGFCGNLFD